ncbi:hypothetical protein FGO68_gene5123 [Halteria grandinella]|uniref:Uncharacterized protein n=1 Tax=Halteria grandinella TaxID=5974 RepID=A0A8J8NAM8_HALGN|nr:hypothetical protein FGO68_gene5123 [Halteria grandinella]
MTPLRWQLPILVRTLPRPLLTIGFALQLPSVTCGGVSPVSSVSGFHLLYLISSPETQLMQAAEKKLTKPEELLSRFRSKEDLYRYMTVQGKTHLLLPHMMHSQCVPPLHQGNKGGLHA